MCYTCSSGRDKSSIQACSKSGDIVCVGGGCGGGGGDSEPGERVAGGRAGGSGDIIDTTAVVSRQTEVFCQTNTRIWPFLYNYKSR